VPACFAAERGALMPSAECPLQEGAPAGAPGGHGVHAYAATGAKSCGALLSGGAHGPGWGKRHAPSFCCVCVHCMHNRVTVTAVTRPPVGCERAPPQRPAQGLAAASLLRATRVGMTVYIEAHERAVCRASRCARGCCLCRRPLVALSCTSAGVGGGVHVCGRACVTWVSCLLLARAPKPYSGAVRVQ
jgi:hypothetical protein